MKERWRIAILPAVVILVYANSLLNSFTMDDNMYILTNRMVTNPSLRGLFEPTSYNNVFRPVTFATLALNWRIAGAGPFGYHLLNLLLHAAVTVLLYLVFRKLLDSFASGPTVAWVAALLFAVHPLHTEAVDSISARSELLATGFLLAAWLLHLVDRPILALLSFVLALLSKESAVAFVPLVLAGDYARGKLKPLYRYASVVGVAVVYLALLWTIQGGQFGEKAVSFLDNPLAHLPASLRILNALRISWKYLGLHVFPVTLSCDYSYNAIPIYASWRYGAAAAVATFLGLGLLLWAFRAGKREWVLAGAIYVCGFAATANLLTPTGTILGERLAYLPSAGFCLLVALIWIQLANRQSKVAGVVLVVLVLVFAGRTVARNRDWHDNFTLFLSAVRAVPGSAKSHSNLGLEYYTLDQVDAADKELQTALRIYPQEAEALGFSALIESRKGHDREARALLEKCLSLMTKENPNYEFMAVNLAAVMMKLGQNEAALKLLDNEIAHAPTYSRAWSNRAVIRYQRGEIAMAHSDAEMAVRLDPSNQQAENLLGLLSNTLRPTP
ncbi:MAG: tetratricopeptide repeat protein [Candidatus Acidiferrum sp.]|jgi:Tfp pilus assembly protein PilF